MVKSKSKALRHFKVDPVLKIDETVHKQTESMCALRRDHLDQHALFLRTTIVFENDRKSKLKTIH